jgi:hypothetical protein
MAGPISGAARPATRAEQRPPQRGDDLEFIDDEDLGPFHIDPARIPNGMTYKYLRVTYGGKGDARSEARGQRNRWTPVPKKRHPEVVGREAATKDPDGAIIIDGLMLVERAASITEAVSARDLQRARDRVANQEKSLRLTAEGQMPRHVQKLGKKHNIQVADTDAESGADE